MDHTYVSWSGLCNQRKASFCLQNLPHGDKKPKADTSCKTGKDYCVVLPSE